MITFIVRQPNKHVAKPLVHTFIIRQPGIHTSPLLHVFIVNQPNKHTISPLVHTFIIKQPDIYIVEPLGRMLVIVSSLNNPG